MIYLLITIAGVMLIILGFYFMTFGFSTPPSFGMFLLGLCLFVTGMLLTLIFAARIDLGSLGVEWTPKTRSRERVSGKRAVKPIRRVPRREYERREALEKVKEAVKSETPVKGEEVPVEEEVEAPVKGEEVPVKEEPLKKFLGFFGSAFKRKTPEAKKRVKATREPIIPRKVAPRKPTPSPSKAGVKDADYVKDRLNRLKKNHFENIDDVEDLIEDRLESLRGTLDRIRTRPRIIWSFDTNDVQETIKDILGGARESIVMMYPWIRNIDISVLKKFTDINSRLIIQEASLDDDASVELIKILLDNNVKVRTMPHIHTVAAVSDNNRGFIISTDPIYESFEVGVIYNDKESIEEIRRLFEEAWSLSDKISLGGG